MTGREDGKGAKLSDPASRTTAVVPSAGLLKGRGTRDITEPPADCGLEAVVVFVSATAVSCSAICGLFQKFWLAPTSLFPVVIYWVFGFSAKASSLAAGGGQGTLLSGAHAFFSAHNPLHSSSLSPALVQQSVQRRAHRCVCRDLFWVPNIPYMTASGKRVRALL